MSASPKLPILLLCALMPGLLALSSPVHAGSTKALAKHALIEVIRDTGGRPVMTPGGQFVSSNWSGYVLPSFQTGDTYTSVEATWVVPDVAFADTKRASTEWIGIGGFCIDPRCTKVDHTLIQFGTAANPLGGPENVYFAWGRIQTGPLLGTSLAVGPGDTITTSLSCNPCTGNQSWTLSMTNLSNGDSWVQDFPYQSSKLSAEFIVGTMATLPLANYGGVTLDQSMANDSGADLAAGYGIVLQEPHASSNVSALSPTGDGFSACFGHHKKLVDCSFIPLP